MSRQKPKTAERGGFDLSRYFSSNVNFIAVGIGIILAVVLVIVLRALGPILKPLFIAIFVCILISPVAGLLKKIHIPRPVGYLIIFLAVTVVGFFLGKLISLNVKAFMTKLPAYEATVKAEVVQLDDWIGRIKILRDVGVTDEFRLAELELADYVSAEKIRGYVTATLGSLVGFAGNGLVVIVLMIFILLEADRFPARVRYAYGGARSKKYLEIAADINRDVLRYLTIKTGIAAVAGVIFAGLLSACGVEFAVLWGVSAFLLHFIPYVGSYAAIVLPVLTVLVQFFPSAALLMLVVLSAIQFLLGNYVEPRVMGRELKLSPLFILMALAFWGWVWGVVGVFLAVPITATIKIAMESFPRTRSIARLMSDVIKTTAVADDEKEADKE
jgi:AI-2 transport protein TqsA